MANGLAGASGALSGAGAGAALGPLGAVAGGVLGGLAGLFGGGGMSDEEKEAMQNAVNALQHIGLPPDLSNPLSLQFVQQAGILKPELIQKISLNADKQNQLIENDSVGKKEQQNSLNALKQLSQTGLSPSDLAAYRQLQSKVAQDTQAKTNQILADQQARGQASGGNALAAQLLAAQGSSQNASAEADRLAQAATEARRAALGQFAGLSSQMRGTDLDLQKLNLQNELARQQFIDQNSLARQQQNVAQQNQANLYNTQRQQNVSDYNTQMGNQELQRQAQAKEQNWKDRLAQAQSIANVYSGQAKNYADMAANQAGSNQNLISAGLSGLKGLAGSGIFNSGASYGTGVGKAVNPTGLAADQINALDNYKIPGHASGGLVPEVNAHSAVANIRKLTEHEDKFLGSVPTDTEQHDKVPAMLSPGEIVIPKSFSHDPDLAKAYINFIHKQKKQTTKK